MSDIILAIDTALNYCSVAIHKKNDIHSIWEISEKQHTAKILPMIQKLLLHTKTRLSELNVIAFANGPGNFTSMRIATGIAQSFAMSLNIPIIKISTLVLLAEKSWRKHQKKKY